MSKHFIKQANEFASVQVIGESVLIKNEQNNSVVMLSFGAYDEMVKYVKDERKEPLPTFEDVRGILEEKKGE